MAKSYILLIRPANVVIVVASVAIGSFMGGHLASLAVLVACVSAGLILAGGNCLNDVFDVEIDGINNPERPIPSGRVSTRGASFYGGALLAAGTCLSAIIGLKALSIAASASVLLVLYGLWLKSSLLVGNLVVSLLGGLAFIYGGLAVGNPRSAWFPAVFAFLFHLGREVVKDAQDAEGDRRSGVRSLATVFGERTGLIVASAVFLLLMGVTVLPFARGEYGHLYFALVLIGVDLVLVLSMLPLLTRRRWMSLSRASSLLKVGMVMGLAALAVSGV